MKTLEKSTGKKYTFNSFKKERIVRVEKLAFFNNELKKVRWQDKKTGTCFQNLNDLKEWFDAQDFI